MSKTPTKPAPTDPADDELAGSPLFDLDEKEIAFVTVIRDDPEEGLVGRVTSTATELDIRRKFGGGTFTLQGRNAMGRPVKGAWRQVQIAGDPIFVSDTAARKWKQQQGVRDDRPPAANTNDRPMGIQDMILLMTKLQETARAEARDLSDLRAREAEAAHARQIELLRLDAERRQQEAREQLDRAQREAEAARQRDREFFGQLAKITAEQSSRRDEETPTKMLFTGIELATKLMGKRGGGGGGEDGDGDKDPVTALINNLPEIIAQARETVVQSMRGRSAPPADEGGGDDGADGAGDEDEDTVTLEGEMAAKARKVVAHLASQGKDPEAVLSRVMDALMKTRKAEAEAEAAPAKPTTPPRPRKKAAAPKGEPKTEPAEAA